MKKLTSIVVLVTMMFTLTVPVHGAAKTYSDAKTSDWFYSSLDTLSKNNIIDGYPDNTFKPSNVLNVDQYITMLCRLTDNDVGKSTEYWAQNYIDYALESGWLEGMSFTNYATPINRYQASRLTVKAMAYDSDRSPSELEAYKVYINDYNAIPYKYRTDVLLNYALGLTNGYPDSTFQGTNTLTRAEAAVISHRVFDPKVRKLLLDPDKTEKLLALFKLDNLDQFALLEPEVIMPAGLMMFLPPAMPMMPAPAPVPIASLPLLPPVAVVTENVLADTLIEMSDLESDNKVSAGYGYNTLKINLLYGDDSVLIYIAEDGSNIISLDLLQMMDENNNLRDDAKDIISIVCNNIDPTNGDAMQAFILDQYAHRDLIPQEGITTTYGTTDLLLTDLHHDHNVTKVQFTLN